MAALDLPGLDLEAPVEQVARGLLGARLTLHGVVLRITETEAYAGADDDASHARVRTARSEIMFGPPGLLYVYRIHTHHCGNIVTGPDGSASAVLLRAGVVESGLELARTRRPGVAEAALARGPGNLGRALGLSLGDNGTDLTDLVEPPTAPGLLIASGPRIGISRATDRRWRFWVEGDSSVSRPR